MSDRRDRLIYLDNAATSWPKPPGVNRAMAAFHLEQGGGPSRGGHRLAVAATRVVDEARAKLANLFGVSDPARMIHCFNCSDALNMAIKGVLREGDHVVCTALDHNSISRPLEAMVRRGFISLTRVSVGANGMIDPDDIRAAITPKTKLLATVHASNVTGAITPAAELARIAREHDLLFLLDAAQTAGVVDIHVDALAVDLLAFPGHKALLGPMGTGGLYVGTRATLNSFREGGTGFDSDFPTQPEDYPTWLEAGTPNAVGLAGLVAALAELDPPATLRHERTLIQRVIDGLSGDDRITLYRAPSVETGVGCLSFRIAGLDPQDTAAILDESFDIAVRAGLHCAPYIHRALGSHPDGTVRISLGPNTTEAEVDTFIAAVREIAGSQLEGAIRSAGGAAGA